jgi:hypothetical protein
MIDSPDLTADELCKGEEMVNGGIRASLLMIAYHDGAEGVWERSRESCSGILDDWFV